MDREICAILTVIERQQEALYQFQTEQTSEQVISDKEEYDDKKGQLIRKT